MKQKKVRFRIITFILKLIGVCSFLLLWEILVKISSEAISLLPPPSSLPSAFKEEFESGLLLINIGQSSIHTFLGIFSGSLLGVIGGLITSRSKTLELILSPILGLLRPIPPIAWVPFSLVIFGSGTLAATYIVGVGVFWTTFITTTSAVDSVNPNLIELAQVYKITSSFNITSKIILPASLPAIMGGIRTALGQGWSLVVAAELLGVPGMGQRMWEASGVLSNDIVIIYMFMIALAFSLSDFIFLTLNRRLFKWRG